MVVRTPADRIPERTRRSRGAITNATPRYDSHKRVVADDDFAFDDGWSEDDLRPTPLTTEVTIDRTRSIIARNQSPDLGFDRSINPYRGCEHGCIYCFARPTHAYLGLSPGLDFETRIFAKPEAAGLLDRELRRPGYRCRTIALGTNTDPYQPVERRWRITRSVLEVLRAFEHPFTIVTKSAMVVRDLDIIAPMAARGMARVALSITTLDRKLARRMEPRAAAPARRLDTIRRLVDAGVPTAVMVAPVIPALNDAEMEAVIEEAAAAGAVSASYVLVRLPLEIKDLFHQWLREHEPLKAARVIARIRDTRGGRDYDSAFRKRHVGEGVYARLVARRFALASRRLGLDRALPALDATRFQAPIATRSQMSLFDEPPSGS